jgi:hypothetical protein
MPIPWGAGEKKHEKVLINTGKKIPVFRDIFDAARYT